MSCLPQVLFSYNTTPHQATGESPHFLMFGQEPRLPVDFLLGRVSNPVKGEVHDWMVEHQTRLQVAFDGAQDRLRIAAEHRKGYFDSCVRDVPLEVNQVVFLRECALRGRQKIQDAWSSVVYKVIGTPSLGGSVYTIAPVDDVTKVKRVHRSLLKPQVLGNQALGPCTGLVMGAEFVVGGGDGPLGNSEMVVEDSMDEVDLWVVQSEPRQEEGISASTTRSVSRTVDGVSHSDLEVSLGQHPESSGSLPQENEALPRRSRRPTAGQHSNVYRLPRPVGETVGGVQPVPEVMSNAVIAFFRPWN